MWRDGGTCWRRRSVDLSASDQMDVVPDEAHEDGRLLLLRRSGGKAEVAADRSV